MVQIGAQFTVTNPADYRNGRTFQIVGFNADKGGSRYAVCEDVNDQATSFMSLI